MVVPSAKTQSRRYRLIIQRIKNVKLNIVKLKASVIKFSQGKMDIKLEYQKLKLK